MAQLNETTREELMLGLYDMITQFKPNTQTAVSDHFSCLKTPTASPSKKTSNGGVIILIVIISIGCCYCLMVGFFLVCGLINRIGKGSNSDGSHFQQM